MRRKLGGIVLIVFFSLAGLLTFLTHPLRGYQLQIILSGSMAPAIRAGSVVITQVNHPEEYQAGEVVTFHAPDSPSNLITHRITRVYQNESGALVADTQGDANNQADPWQLSLGNIVGKVVTVIPNLGYILAMARTQFGFLVFLLISFMFLITPELRFLAETWVKRPAT